MRPILQIRSAVWAALARLEWRAAAAVGLGAAIICVSGVTWPPLRAGWLRPWCWLLPALGLAEWVHRRRAARGGEPRFPQELVPTVVLAGALLVFLFSCAAAEPRFYFLRWRLAGGSGFRPAADRWSSWLWPATAAMTPLFLWFGLRKRELWLLLLGLLVFSQARCVLAFLRATSGTTLYGFDHPSFMLRLEAFGKTFPRLLYYDPHWNGGKAATYLISSGATGIGSVFWPLWRWAPVEKVYTPALGCLFIVLVPFATVAAVRAVRGCWSGAFAAGTLALAVSRHWFTWLLHFGTVASCLALSLLGLTGACLFRVLGLDVRTVRTGAALVLTAFLVATWPPGAIALLPLGLATLACARAWTARKISFLAACALALAALLAPYALGVLFHVGERLGHYMRPPGTQAGAAGAWARGLSRLPPYFIASNPILLFLGFGGAFFLAHRDARVFFAAALLGLLALALWGREWKPELELNRALLAWCFLAAVPAGLQVGRLLESRAARLAPLQAALLVLLGSTGGNAALFYGNRGPTRYRLLTASLRDFAAWIRSCVPEDGRVLFAGSATHAYGGGTIAFLPRMAGREMMACDYYQFSPRLVEYDYPPRAYRQNAEAFLRFADLYNVTHVVTHHNRWIRFFQRSTNVFEKVFDFSTARRPRVVYRIRRDSSLFLQGRGAVTADFNVLEVRVDDPEEEVVLKYNWADGLKADAGVTLRPFPVAPGVMFIAAHPHGQKKFKIHYRKWF